MSVASSSSVQINGNHANGMNGHVGSEAGTSELANDDANEYVQTPYQARNEEIINHLYTSGFQSGSYADTIVHARQKMFRLHAIMLSKSPLLAHLMSTTPQSGPQRQISIHHLENDAEITDEGLFIALGYLYSSTSLNLIRPDNARGVLAAGCLLGGMNDLCHYAFDICRRSISVDNVQEWLRFVNKLTSTAENPSSPFIASTTVFGPFAQWLRDELFNFLITTLPEQLMPVEGGSNAEGRQTLLQVFSHVPFDMFKTAVESPSFDIGSDQARFKFAKDAIDLRKRGIARGLGEETVVLAFGGGSGATVQITRKMRKRNYVMPLKLAMVICRVAQTQCV